MEQSVLPPDIQMALGAVLSLAFVAVCVRDIRAGVVTYLLTGWIPIDVVPVAGERITAGLRPAQVFATILIAVWLLRWRRARRQMFPEPFALPLLVLLPLGVLSLLAGFAFADPAVDARHLKPVVSAGQLLLILWPIGIYAVTADVIGEVPYAERMVTLLGAVGIFSLLVPVLPRQWSPLVGWTQPLALFASPFCLARVLAPGPFWRRTWMAAVWLAPLAIGLWVGRAFFYGYWAVATAVVMTFTLKRRLLMMLPVGAAVVVLYLAFLPDGQLPGPLQSLVQEETEQQSLGGRSGRFSIWTDALTIWSGHPLLGVGPGNSWPYMHRYSVIDTPHSQYLNILLEFGVAGLACFLAFLVTAVRTGLQAHARASTAGERRFLVGWIGGFAGMAVGSAVGDFVLHSIRNGGLELFSQFYPFWVLLGAMAGLWRTSRSRHAYHAAPATSPAGADAA